MMLRSTRRLTSNITRTSRIIYAPMAARTATSTTMMVPRFSTSPGWERLNGEHASANSSSSPSWRMAMAFMAASLTGIASANCDPAETSSENPGNHQDKSSSGRKHENKQSDQNSQSSSSSSKTREIQFRSPDTPFKSHYRDQIETMMFDLQDEICDAISEIDGGSFHEDQWQRPNDGGGGRSRVLQHGNVIEKGGVNVSVIHGRLPASAVKQMKARGKDIFGEDLPFYVTGVSLVIHPRNPHAPTVHANFRFFEVLCQDTETGEEKLVWWFGGGTDLTPHYLYEEDARHFHSVLKKACDEFGEKGMYGDYKKWCDDYFWISHRNEARGVGGIFFDDLEELPSNSQRHQESQEEAKQRQKRCFDFVKGVGNSFLSAYIPILTRRKDMPYNFDQQRWQKLRHGRYVEFNLVHDRGTKFGLATPGSRIESILMSLPLTASWEYCHEPDSGSEEERLLNVLKHPKDWVETGN